MTEHSDPPSRSILESAFTRLRHTIEAKDVSTEHLRVAALEALERARAEIELDPMWVSEELDRMRKEADKPKD